MLEMDLKTLADQEKGKGSCSRGGSLLLSFVRESEDDKGVRI